MTPHRLLTVDVFTRVPLRGNPVAVVLAADDVPADAMQRIAAWTNLSETTFVLRPTRAEADYRLRIFSPRRELPFAGHPTVGSAHAVLEAGVVGAGTTRLVQECGAGLLPLRVEGEGPGRRIFVRAPEARVLADRVDAARVGRAAGVPVVAEPAPLAIDVGPRWLVAQVAGEDALRGARPDLGLVADLTRAVESASGLTLFALSGGPAGVVVRSFAPLAGVPEDPVCGSGNAAVAAYVSATGLLERTGRTWTASQGRELGRDGTVHVSVDGRAIEIGGSAVTVVRGEITA
jgi:PhzF family phenazine biosynthesis protein